MNFYKHYIGDYQRDTGHLSITEHGAFRLMLDVYYATEKPLPLDRKAIYRLLRAESSIDRIAIDSIINQFWVQTNEGFINRRADVEVSKAEKQAEVNRQTAIAREAKRRATQLAQLTDEQSTNRGTDRSTIGQRNHSHSQTVNLNPPSQGEDSLTPLPIRRGFA